MEITVKIKFDKPALKKAVKFLQGGNAENVDAIIEDFFKPDISIDFNKIVGCDERYFHMNGIAALLITLQEASINKQ